MPLELNLKCNQIKFHCATVIQALLNTSREVPLSLNFFLDGGKHCYQHYRVSELFWLDNNDYVCIYYTIYFVNAKSSEWSHFIINLLTSDLKSVKKAYPSLYKVQLTPRSFRQSLTRLLRGRPEHNGGEDFITSIDNVWYFSLIVSIAYHLYGIISFLESGVMSHALKHTALTVQGLPRWR